MGFLKNLKIKAKLMLLLFIVLLSIISAVFIVFDKYDQNRKINEVSQLIDLATEISALLHETQKERGATAGFIGSNGTDFKQKLLNQRDLTDKRAKSLNSFLQDFNKDNYNNNFVQLLDLALSNLNGVDSIRRKVNNLSISGKEAITYYTKSINDIFLKVVAEISLLSEDPKLSKKLSAYRSFLYSKERAGIERAVLSNTFALDKFADGMFAKFSSLVAEQDAFMLMAEIYMDEKSLSYYTQVIDKTVINEVQRMRDIANENYKQGGFDIEPTYWFDTITKKINMLKKAEDFMTDELLNKTEELKSKTFSEMILFSIFTVVSTIIVFFIFIVIQRNIIKSVYSIEQGLLSFFDYLNGETSRINFINLDTKDDFGLMAELINKNIKSIEEGLNLDNSFVNEVLGVTEEIKHGKFRGEITSLPSNLGLVKLKDLISEMLESLKNNIGEDNNKIIEILRSFAALDFSQRINNPTGRVEVSLNKVAEDVSNMLLINLQNGEKLDLSTVKLNTSFELLTEEFSKQETLSNNLMHEMKNVSDTSENVSTNMKDLEEKVVEIKYVLSVIADIADQTKLLALNAAIEAARAGEYGRGFSVVADEVKKLSERTQESLTEIQTNINDLIQVSSETVSSSSKTKEVIGEINTLIEEMFSLTQGNLKIVNTTKQHSSEISDVSLEIKQEAENKKFGHFTTTKEL